MKDTSEEVLQLQRQLLMERSGEERFRMAVSMCQAARTIVRSSLPDDLTPGEQRAHLFLRLYGSDFSPAERTQIIERLHRDCAIGR